MKIICSDPAAAARVTGGVTWEQGIGWWTQVPAVASLPGMPLLQRRDAIYVPSLQKTGGRICERVRQQIIDSVRDAGLSNISQAVGGWLLSGSGSLQTEAVTILYAPPGRVQKNLIGMLVALVHQLANQDAVAYEVDGVLNFVPQAVALAA